MSHVPTAAVRWRAEVANVLRQPGPRSDGMAAGLFDPRLRRWALLWVCVSLPVITGIAAVVATTPNRYLVVFAVLASGAYTTPALLFTYLAARRAPRPDNWCWWLWLVALVLMYGIGCAMVLGAATGYAVPSSGERRGGDDHRPARDGGRRVGRPHAVRSPGGHRRPGGKRHVRRRGDCGLGASCGATTCAPPRRRLVRRARVTRRGGDGVRPLLGRPVVRPPPRRAPRAGRQRGDRARRRAPGDRGTGERRGADGPGDHRVRAAQRTAARAPRRCA